ncbi:MAG: hypothetical protein JWQ16_2184, partial [Novosphingobium sp.]|nr:hypothetical protein [Novosphingobium sp.]
TSIGIGIVVWNGHMIPTANEMDEFQLITIAENDIGQGRTRDDLAIALHRDLLRVELQAGNERGDRRAR